MYLLISDRINPDGAASVSKSPSFHNSITYRLGSSTEGLGSEEDVNEPLPQFTGGSLTRMSSMNMQRCQLEDVHYTTYATNSNIPRPKHKLEVSCKTKLRCCIQSGFFSISYFHVTLIFIRHWIVW